MLIVSLFALPGALAILSAAVRRIDRQLVLLVAGAAAHLGLTVSLWLRPLPPPGPLLGLDPLSLIVLSLVSLLFLAAALYSVAYLRRDAGAPSRGATQEAAPGAAHTAAPGGSALRSYVPLLFAFAATMSLVTVSRDLALIWAAVEATTLASAPLILLHRRGAALEAAWKYLLICSVGIALALFGTFALQVAAAGDADAPGFGLEALIAAAPALDARWIEVAFVLAVIGYGTKMGLVPLHTWLPDAHGQAPSPVSALLSGALLNCAFLGILRFYQICLAAGDAAFAQRLLIVIGLLSLGAAAAFMIGQRDYKRLLAYSSVENMGILAVGAGLGGQAAYGAVLHALNHSLGKGALFMLAGNLLQRFGTTRAGGISGVFRRLPISGALFACALFAIAGSPPFGPFLSEFTIFAAAMTGPHLWVGAAFALLIAVAFIGLATVAMPMLQGGDERPPRPAPEPILAWGPPLLLLCGVLLLGLYVPPFLSAVLAQAAALIEGA